MTDSQPTAARPPVEPGIVRWRRRSQLGFLALFVVLFAAAGRRHESWLGIPVEFFLSLDLLVTIKTFIAAHRMATAVIVPGLVVLLLTLWGGRIFCGWICPLGTVIDGCDRGFMRSGRLRKRQQPESLPLLRRLKYLYLFLGLGALIFGVDLLGWGDPISLLTRSMTVAVLPPTAFLVNKLLLAAQLGGQHWQVDFSGWQMQPVTFDHWLGVLGILLAVIGLSLVQERFWCRNVCPLGALLGLLSSFSTLRHRMAPQCNHCGKCELQSRMGAYSNTNAKHGSMPQHSLQECIACFRCTGICPEQAIVISPTWPVRPGNPAPSLMAPEPMDVGRRRMLGALGLGLVAGLSTRAGARQLLMQDDAYRAAPEALRPPGALTELDFLSACTRCGECMRVCPSNGLQPALFETGLEGLWTPVLVPSMGPCIEHCTACGDVCPTTALQPFTVADKRHRLKLGLAEINRNTCLAWNRSQACLVCAEVCPYSAVVAHNKAGAGSGAEWRTPNPAAGEGLSGLSPARGGRLFLPVVDLNLCTGCGICEFNCPVKPDNAIKVKAGGQRREIGNQQQRGPATNAEVTKQAISLHHGL